MTIQEYLRLFREDALQRCYFEILSDKKPHCRNCAQKATGSQQLAGGGGVQGLQRGTRMRPGVVIVTEQKQCDVCNTTGAWDRWTGEFKEANPASGIPARLQKRIKEYYQYTDAIEQRARQTHELIVDHRFPMTRWESVEESNPTYMSEDEIERKFQLLKKDDSGNHNLLKSRACESCYATGKRGYPMGIKFYYAGNEDWPDNCPRAGVDAEKGCVGCGWYDIGQWRTALNDWIRRGKSG